ncbi:MAG TPA: asparagine synthase (glutamine-hydrolyzing) [bacterium]|nr:asparagine synthase (glutamine-hydrolyzing) [bacterium]
MCGIVGIWRQAGHVSVSEITRMSELISHRGPDDAGAVLIQSRNGASQPLHARQSEDGDNADLGLAARRLAIIDLSSAGHQPMSDGGCTLVYNGEIYNYVELRQELETLGHSFRSTSDTEVLLHSYLEWGTGCLPRLNGIFAFAVWDARSRQLVCARDRLGVKPFYYHLSGSEFIFASEIRSILAVLPRRPDPATELVYDFLAAGRLDHTDDTFFKGIRRLPAASVLTIDQRGLRSKEYWKLTEQAGPSCSLQDSVERFRDVITDAVRLQMRADVTVGCLLSGGMDSSAVVGVASGMTPRRMGTFTVRYEDPQMDEWRYAEAVASSRNADIVPLVVTPDDFWTELPQVVRSQEEPFGGPPISAEWLLMRTIHRAGLRVVLNGQGGDEILCGYAKYYYYSLFEMWRRRQLGSLLAALGIGLFNGGSHLISLVDARRYGYVPAAIRSGVSHLLQPEFRQEHAGRDVARPWGSVRRQQIMDLMKYSCPILLRYDDKNAMAHSIEARVPLLDHRLVELAVGLPLEHKLFGARAKRVMRIALKDLIPDVVLRRRTKLGFGGTFTSWVDQLGGRLRVWLDSRQLAIDPYVRREALREHVDRKDASVFRPLILDTWLECYGYKN